jgi:hypothetical protein
LREDDEGRGNSGTAGKFGILGLILVVAYSLRPQSAVEGRKGRTGRGLRKAEMLRWDKRFGEEAGCARNSLAAAAARLGGFTGILA